MVRTCRRVMLTGLLALAWAAPALADDRAPATSGGNDRGEIAELRSLIDAQRSEIGDLKRQVAAQANQDVDKARMAQMRQQIKEILGEREFRESLMPSVTMAGYDNGFYIKSSDDKFKMQFNGLIQFRWTYYENRNENRYLLPRFHRDDRSGFDVQRIRFAVNGNAYDPNLTYHIEFKSDAPQNGNFVLDSGWANYRFADEFQLKAGLFGLSSIRSQAVGGSEKQLVDAGIVDAVFGFGAGVGVRLWGQVFNKRLDYALDIVNGTADDGNTILARTITPDPAETDNNPAILFRTVWHILGDKPGIDFGSESDIDFHQSPAWDFGFSYAFNDVRNETGTTRLPVARLRPFGIPGGFGLVPSNGVQLNQFGFDTAFKLQGFSITGEYIVRLVDPRRTSFDQFPYSPWYLASGDDSTTAQHGAYVQAGYFLPIPGHEKQIEVVARIGGISALAHGAEGTWEYAAGVNYYPMPGNGRVKLQTDFAKISEVPTTSSYSSLANVNDDALFFRVQLQVAF